MQQYVSNEKRRDVQFSWMLHSMFLCLNCSNSISFSSVLELSVVLTGEKISLAPLLLLLILKSINSMYILGYQIKIAIGNLPIKDVTWTNTTISKKHEQMLWLLFPNKTIAKSSQAKPRKKYLAYFKRRFLEIINFERKYIYLYMS